MYKQFVRLAMMSAADTCIVPIQDWLGLDNSSRMNTPGTVEVNWSWRLLPGQVTEELCEEVRNVSKRYGRANWEALNALEERETAEAEETLA
jgi:4-alpha-glucanotransferase